MPTYPKLVRDEIPALIAVQGRTCTTRILETEEYITALRTKLREEAEEYLAADTSDEALEELADLLEVIHVLAGVHGADPARLEAIRARKAGERGGFAKRIMLLGIEE
ncbi:nucleoside triphosphate pyrophosphohydrolase ['Paenibacillus yunnanensis' Narsing Rao et al. 2020]|uniref:nucleoside triphosphate pyrophosphohydrolase n=1 Tax=Paenibacillus tengchongensis TaxID=2608684 RepID=UPI00124E7A8F|nr:nucleoside triphosphate pyrophosphohydrolase [Paenibacillus tengchongensis]